MLNSIKYSLPADLENTVRTTLAEWRTDDKINRIWSKDAGVWTDDDEAKWLGWLDSVAGGTRKNRGI